MLPLLLLQLLILSAALACKLLLPMLSLPLFSPSSPEEAYLTSNPELPHQL